MASWEGFRGGGNSHTEITDLPLMWSEDEGIAWKVDLAGYGQSSPVAWGDQVYVTSTGGDRKEKLYVEAFSIGSGDRLWVREFSATQTAEEVTDMISRGAPTPVCDEHGVIAFFESGDIVALDREGEVRWERSLTEEYGEYIGGHGIGSSVVDAGDSVVLLADHDGPSYLLRLSKEDGGNIWKREREPRTSWTTPLLVHPEDGEPRIVVSSNRELAGYRLGDGEKVWWFDGVEGNTVASPSSDGEIIVIGSSTPMNCLAVELGGEGDVTETHLAWKAESVTSSFGSPLIHDDRVFFVNRAGALQTVDRGSGEVLWKRRLPSSTWASALSAGERIYFFCKDGQTVVFDAKFGEDTEPLAESTVPVPEGDRVYGYAVAPGMFLIRTGEAIMAVGEPKSP